MYNRQFRLVLIVGCIITLSAIVLRIRSAIADFVGINQVDETALPIQASAFPKGKGQDLEVSSQAPSSRRPVEPVPFPGKGDVVIQGQCIDILSKTPVPNILVEIIHYDSRDWSSIIKVNRINGLDEGKFLAVVQCGESTGLKVSIFSLGYVPRTKLINSQEITAVIDFGVINMFNGFQVQGEVLDANKMPPQITMMAWESVDIIPKDSMDCGQLNSVRLKVDKSGRFVSPNLIRGGEWTFGFPGGGVNCLSPTGIMLVKDEIDLEIRVSLRPRIMGHVVDIHGAPVPFVNVVGFDAQTGIRASAGNVSTKSDGSFILTQDDSALETALIRVIATSRFYRLLEAPLARWGNHGLFVMVEELPAVQISVVNASSGLPIEEFGVVLRPDRILAWRDTGIHPAGILRVELPDLSGEFFLSVATPCQLFRPILHRQVDVPGSGCSKIQVALKPSRQWQLRVIDINGHSACNANVDVVTSVEPCKDSDIISACIGANPKMSIFNYQGSGPMVLSSGCTDRNGVVQLMAAEPSDGQAFIRVASKGSALKIMQIQPHEFHRTGFDVFLEGGCTVSGRIPSAVTFIDRVRVGLVSKSNSILNASRFSFSEMIQRDGRFVFDGIPMGQWDLVLLAWPSQQLLGTLTPLNFTEIGSPQVLGDLPYMGPWPGHIAGMFTCGGIVPSGAVVRAIFPGSSIVLSECRVKPSGSWMLPPLAPGKYNVEISTRNGHILFTGAIEVQSGVEVRIDHVN